MIIVEGSFMVFSELFPNAFVSNEAIADQNVLVIPYQQGFLHLPKASLTEREMALIEFLSPSDKVVIDNTWLSFFQGDSALPLSLSEGQMILIGHQRSMPSELLNFFKDLFPNLFTLASLGKQQTLLLLSPDLGNSVETSLSQLLVTLESDFGLALSFYVGKAWPALTERDLATYWRLEYGLCQQYHALEQEEPVISFARLMLRAMTGETSESAGALREQLLETILPVKDSRDLITVLWQEQGNLVQTAQRLFIHRNSLQYRLDKFYQATGLNLKVLDDLALAYLIILQD
ncbi:PucR family transcriptional regulator [Streptococcus hyovaginalis]